MAKNLQRQGIPIPDHLSAPKLTQGQPGYNRQRMRELKGQPPISSRPANRSELRAQGIPVSAKRAPGNSARMSRSHPGTGTTYFPNNNVPNTTSRSTPNFPDISNFSPVKAGENVGDIGGLMAEFLAAMGLLILLMFSDQESAYTDKIMSFIKRGSLTCLLFFILALLNSTGPNMAKIGKAIGALVIVGLLVTSPTNTMLSDIDKLIKNDWVGTSPTDPNSDTGNTSGSANTGTGNNTSSEENTVFKAITGTASAASEAALNKIHPGLGSLAGAAGEGAGQEYAATRLASAIVSGNWSAAENAASSLSHKATSTIEDIWGGIKGIL